MTLNPARTPSTTDMPSGGGGIVRDPNRDLDLQHIAALLRDQQARQTDVIAGAGALHAHHGRLQITGLEPHLGPDGVTAADGVYDLNDIALTGVADKLGIPIAYLRKLAGEHPGLFDANVNGWLERDPRRFLLRTLRATTTSLGQPGPSGTGTRAGLTPSAASSAGSGLAGGRGGSDGVVRAFLSDRYAVIDNLDVLLAVLDGIRATSTGVRVEGCSLTERRMHVRVTAPDVQAMAPTLLRRYRSPFDGRPGADLPVVFAGFVVTNSETGCGAFTIAPRLTVQVCSNGMVIDAARMRRTHLGGRHTGDDGLITRSAETLARTLDLITARTKDAVRAYLSRDYLTRQVRELEAVAGAPVTDPDTSIKTISTRMRFSEDQQAAILTHFIHGADPTAGGVLHAITSVAQTVPDPDDAHDLEQAAIPAMRLAVSLR